MKEEVEEKKEEAEEEQGEEKEEEELVDCGTKKQSRNTFLQCGLLCEVGVMLARTVVDVRDQLARANFSFTLFAFLLAA